MGTKILDSIHKYIVPILYVLLWSIGIISIGEKIINSLGFDAKNLVYRKYFLDALTIYVLFVFEFGISIIDTSILNAKTKTQYGKFLNFLICIIGIDLIITTICCSVFMLYLPKSVIMFSIVFSLMVALKGFSILFEQNKDALDNIHIISLPNRLKLNKNSNS